VTSSSLTSARLIYLIAAGATIAVGLWVHRGIVSMNADARDILGDALWASMMMWLVSLVAPTVRLAVRAAIALAICFAVETSQLIHTPTLDAVRATTLGNLVLGSGFDARDFAAYTAGVIAAVLIASAASSIRRSPTSAIQKF
jgi:hypothetical protein